MSKDLILVTGASGFIASFIVKDLLEHGYRVKGTVRSLDKKDKYTHLYKLKNADKNLELVEADLLKEGSFDSHTKGVDGVFHTASPFFWGSGSDPQKDLVDPALKGTRNVLNAAHKNKDTIKRVVLTSSIAAISGGKSGNPPVYDENDWNNSSSLENGPYAYSKSLAEKEAWKLVKEWRQNDEKMFDLVTINPSLVTGPIIHAERVKAYGRKELNQSCSVVRDYITRGNDSEKKNEKLKASEGFPIVDVRDVARSHRLGYEVKEAGGNRHICCAGTGMWYEILPKLKKELEGKKGVNIVAEFEGDFEEGKKSKSIFSTKQILERLTGFGEFISPYDSILATAESLIENELL